MVFNYRPIPALHRQTDRKTDTERERGGGARMVNNKLF